MRSMPTYFLSHGGGPWSFMEGPMREQLRSLELSLQDVPKQLPDRPRAVLVVSGHWEEPEFTVSSSPAPGMVYDYSGFPEAMYRITYPAPGDPVLAERVRSLLSDAGITCRADAHRGYDHGTFSMLKPMFPNADVPVVQLSLKQSFSATEHLVAGVALAPLREEGVLILGSGFSYHNMRGFGPQAEQPSALFDRWLRETLASRPDARVSALSRWHQAPAARIAHPREDHLLPLMVAAGAAGDDPATPIFGDRILGAQASGFRFSTDTRPSVFDRLGTPAQVEAAARF